MMGRGMDSEFRRYAKRRGAQRPVSLSSRRHVIPAKAGTYPVASLHCPRKREPTPRQPIEAGVPAYAGTTVTPPLRVGDGYGKLAGKPN